MKINKLVSTAVISALSGLFLGYLINADYLINVNTSKKTLGYKLNKVGQTYSPSQENYNFLDSQLQEGLTYQESIDIKSRLSQCEFNNEALKEMLYLSYILLNIAKAECSNPEYHSFTPNQIDL